MIFLDIIVWFILAISIIMFGLGTISLEKKRDRALSMCLTLGYIASLIGYIIK